MNIIILYRTPYHKIRYHEVIDHNKNNVTYISAAEGIEHIPSTLNCTILIRKETKGYIEEVIALLSESKITPDRIISINEKELIYAAQLREYYGLSGESIENVLNVRDKIRMKSCVSKAGVRVPAYQPLASYLNKRALFPAQIVLKPKDGVSSADVVVYNSQQELDASFVKHKDGQIYNSSYNRFIDPNDFEVEEFIDDEIMHFDGLVAQGKVFCLITSMYVGTCFSYTEGHPFGSFQIKTSDKHHDWVNKVVKSLGIKDGVIHLEAFHQKNDDPIFLEIAHRSGGGSLVKVLNLKTGIFFPHYELQCAMQQSFVLPVPLYCDSYYGHFYFTGHHLPEYNWKLTGHEMYLSDPRLIVSSKQDETKALIRYVSYYSGEIPFDGVIKCHSPKESQQLITEIIENVKVISLEK